MPDSRVLRVARRLGTFTAGSLAWTVEHLGGDGSAAYDELGGLIESGAVHETDLRSKAAWGSPCIVYRASTNLAPGP